MAVELAAAYVSIIPSLKGAQAQIAKDLGAVDASAAGKSIGSNLGKSIAVGTAAVGGAAIGAALVGAVKSAADFQSELNGIKAVSGATSGEMEKVRAKALQLGKDTTFSASESAQAMSELIKAGLSTEDVLNGAADATVNLAAASGTSMPEAATIASNAMNQFVLKAKDMPQVADLIAGAANASAIDVQQFGYSLSQAGAVASLSGLSFKDTATAIAEMGNAGIVGSDAGTSLKTMLMGLSPATDAAAKAMEAYGLGAFNVQRGQKDLLASGIQVANNVPAVRAGYEQLAKSMLGNEAPMSKVRKLSEDLMRQSGATSSAFYDQSGNLKSLADIQGLLQEKLGGLSKQQQQVALSTIFGSDAMRAGAVLMKNGAKGAEDMAAAMSKVKAADVAKTRLEGFNGALEQFKGAVETVAIQVGTALLPALTQMLQWATSIVDKIGPITSLFGALVGGLWSMRDVVVVVGAAWLAWKTVMLATETVGWAVYLWQSKDVIIKATQIALTNAWAAAQAFLNGTLLANPIGLVIAAIVLLVGALILAYQHSETFRTIVQTAWGAIQTAIGWAWEKVIKPVFGLFVDWLQALGTVVVWLWKNVMTPAWDVMATIIKIWWLVYARPILWAAREFIQNVLGPVFTWLWEKVISPVFGWIGGKIDDTWKTVIKPALSALDEAAGKIGPAFEAAKTAVGVAWEAIKKIVGTPIKVSLELVNDFLGALRKLPGINKDNLPDIPIPKALAEYANGGWTGPGGKWDEAGIVHADEFVLSKRARRAIEGQHPGLLDVMNRTGRVPGYATGGRVLPLRNPPAWTTYAGHTGIDYPVPKGTPVFATESGKVSEAAAWNYSYGRHYQLAGGSGFTTIYGHLSQMVAQLGDELKAGQLLGYSGNTGNVRGAGGGYHLHFEVRPGATAAAAAAYLAGADMPAGAKSDSGGGILGSIVDAASGLFDKFVLSKLPDSKLLPLESTLKSIPKRLSFDEGGYATGVGFLPKLDPRPELVLKPDTTTRLESFLSGQEKGSKLDLSDASLNRLAALVAKHTYEVSGARISEADLEREMKTAFANPYTVGV